METIIKPFLEHLIELIDKKNYWSVSFLFIIIFAIIWGLGYLISWIYSQHKARSEASKNFADAIEKRLNCKRYTKNKKDIY